MALVVAALLVAACTPEPQAAPLDDEATSTGSVDTEPTSTESVDDTAESPSTGPVEDTTEAPERVFAAPEFDSSPLPISDGIRIGVLDNGLTYYVQSNDSPGGSVAMRLVVAAGAVNENPRGTGAAHFLEHMMFNGTEKYPGNSLDAALRSIGAEIGPDFNAYTNATETVYQIEVPDQGNNVSVGFDVLAQWASAALITEDEVAAELPVIREEIRIRDETGQGLISLAFEDAYYRDTPYDGIDVSGNAATVSALTAGDLRAFYDTWYRPDNMAIIAVGDRSLDELEEEIEDVFGGLTARGDTVARPETADFALRDEPLVETVIEPSFGDSYVSIDIPVQAWDRGTTGGAEARLIESTLGQMINNRLNEGVNSGRLDLRRGGGGHFAWNRDLAFMGFNIDSDDLVSGTQVLMTELRASVENPFTEAELERAVTALRANADQRLAQYGTIQDRELANTLVSHFLSGADIRSVDESHQWTIDTLDDLDIDAVNEHYGWMMTSAEPIILVVGPNAERVSTVEEHLAALVRASEAELTTFDDDVEEIDVLLDPPEPVEETSRESLSSNDGFELAFANGTRVLFSPSSIAQGQVTLVSESPGGRAELSNADGPLAPAAVSAVSASGVGPWDPVQLRRFLFDQEVSLSPYVADFSEGFSGSAATSDLETMFALLHLMATKPRVDEVPFGQQVEAARDRVEQASLDSATAAFVAMSDARTGGGNLAASPSIAQLDALTEDDAERIFQDRFATLDDHVVVVVGDVDADTVIDLSRRYIATLPEAGETENPTPPPIPDSVVELLSAGSGTASGSYRLLSVGEFGNESVANRVVAEIAGRILNDRLFTVIREELGATYGGRATIAFSDPGDEVELFITVDGDPSRIDEIADTIAAEIKTLSSGGITTDDFNEAVAVVGSEYGFINNSFIIESLFDEAYRSNDQVISRARQVQALREVRPADVTAFLAAITEDAGVIDIRNVPN